MEAVEALALIGGHVNKEILLRNEYLAAENEILHAKLDGRPRLANSERIRLAKLGRRLGLKALRDVAAIVKPETILTWCLVLFGGAGLRRALTEFVGHYHQERNHQGRGNVLLFPSTSPATPARWPAPQGCRRTRFTWTADSWVAASGPSSARTVGESSGSSSLSRPAGPSS